MRTTGQVLRSRLREQNSSHSLSYQLLKVGRWARQEGWLGLSARVLER